MQGPAEPSSAVQAPGRDARLWLVPQPGLLSQWRKIRGPEWLSDFLGLLSTQVGARATQGGSRPPVGLTPLGSQFCKVTDSLDGGTAQGAVL